MRRYKLVKEYTQEIFREKRMGKQKVDTNISLLISVEEVEELMHYFKEDITNIDQSICIKS